MRGLLRRWHTLIVVSGFLFLSQSTSASAYPPAGEPGSEPSVQGAQAGQVIPAQEPGGEPSAEEVGDEDVDDEPGELCQDQMVCERASLSFLITVGIIDLIAVLLAYVIWWIMTGRLWFSAGARFLISLLLPMAGASALIAGNPFASPVLRCCLDSSEMARYIMFSELVPWTSGIVLGAAPVLVGFMLLFVITKLVRR